MSKIFSGYHVVFATKSRRRSIPQEKAREVYNYIYRVLESKGCDTYRINGMGDHVHIAMNLNPCLAITDVIRDVKRTSSLMMKSSKGFPDFWGWGEGFYAHTFSYGDKEDVVEYIRNQETHHRGQALLEEMEWLALKQGLRFHPDDWK